MMIFRSNWRAACTRVGNRRTAEEMLLFARLDKQVEVIDADLLVLDQDDEPLDDVHQLADVARPGVVEEGRPRFRMHRLGLFAVFDRIQVQDSGG